MPTIAATGTPNSPASAGHAADDLALEALPVEMAFAGDHEVGALDRVVQAELVGDQLEAGHELAAERGQHPGDPARRARPGDRA